MSTRSPASSTGSLLYFRLLYHNPLRFPGYFNLLRDIAAKAWPPSIEIDHSMYIGVISDTHGNILRARQAMLIFREFGVERIIHCGDIGSATVLSQFAETPVDFVLGNCDGSEADYREVLEPDRVVCHGAFGCVTIAELEIAFMHGHDQLRFDRETTSGQWNLLCYGHTHQSALWMGCDRTVVLNPGALHRVATPSVAVVKLPEREVTHVNLRR